MGGWKPSPSSSVVDVRQSLLLLLNTIISIYILLLSLKVANSVEVHASVLGHFVPAVAVASECLPAMLNFLASAWKLRRAAKRLGQGLGFALGMWIEFQLNFHGISIGFALDL